MYIQETGQIRKIEDQNTELFSSVVESPKKKFCQWINAMISQKICVVSFAYNGETYIAERLSLHSNSFYVVTFKDYLGETRRAFRLQFADFIINGPTNIS